MPKFTKKPVTIEAMQFDGTVESADAIREWATMPDGMSAECARDSHKGACTYLGIRTLEGTMRANSGDWIIKGVKGEFYPCKPDIFAATYEDAAIALMRGQSERPRAYYCPLDTGPGMLMHNDETAEKMIAYFAPKGQVFIPLFEGQPIPSPPKDTADEQ